MPTFAELKKKAEGVKDSGVTKFQNTKDRHSSVPLKTTNWDPYNRNPTPAASASHTNDPPIPSPRSNAPPPPISRASKPQLPQSPPPKAPKPALPPPPSRTSFRPASSSPSQAQAGGYAASSFGRNGSTTEIQWTKLSQEDKETFFAWLDEFFERSIGVSAGAKAGGVHTNPRSLPPRISYPAQEEEEENVAAPPMHAHASPPSIPRSPIGRGAPPPVAKWSRPNIPASTSSSSFTSASASSSSTFTTTNTSSWTTSHPPLTTHGSAAADLAHYFSPSSTPTWPSPWFTSSSSFQPPHIQSSPHQRSTASWSILGSKKDLFIGVLFSDLSICWAHVGFSTDRDYTSNPGAVERDAVYAPPPEALDEATLIEASETYGPTIAGFAESFLESQEWCGRGECWDLASEALKYFDQWEYVPKPIPSISKMHGHLIFEGAAFGIGNVRGRWRGGDGVIRRGDIVQWKEAKVTLASAGRGAYALLGDPDHTAVIVEDCFPTSVSPPRDGEEFSPADLGRLAVVEQSVKRKPHRSVYEMSGFEKGEVWIWRPVGMEAYLGIESLGPKAPEGVRTFGVE